MMRRSVFRLAAVAVLTLVLSACASNRVTDPYGLSDRIHSAVTTVDRASVDWWMPRHRQVLEQIDRKPIDLILLGDSITHGWEKSGKVVWDQYYASRNAVNMGFGGDRTQHVLWRLANGEIDGINPRLAILMIGTNNSNKQDNSAEEIADGIKSICAAVRNRLPDTKILILAIFPRGDAVQRKDKTQNAGFNAQWAKNNEASRLAAQIADSEMIHYLDINEVFLDENGVLTRDIMPDLLHPGENGYQLWAEAMEPTVKKLMGEK